MPDIDNLNIKIKTESDDAARAIDKLIDGLNSFSRVFQNIGKIEGFSKLEAGTKRITQTFESISKQFEGLGRGFQIKGDFSQITRGLNTLENNLSKAIVKEEELRLGGKTGTAAYENAVKDIVKYRNMIDSVKSSMEETSKATQTMAESVATIHVEPVAEKIENMDAAIKRAADSTRAFTGKWNGVPLPDLNNLEKIDIEKTTEKMKELHQTLKLLKVPDALETDINKLNDNFEKTEQKLEGLKAEFQNALTMGKITESPDDKGYVKFRETIAKTGMELSALSERIKEVKIQNQNLQTEKLENLYANLKKLQIAPIKETNVDKLNASLEKTEQKIEELRIKLQNSLTMGQVKESTDDGGYVRQLEQIAIAEKNAEALRARIAEIKAPPGIIHLDEILRKLPAQVMRGFAHLPETIVKGVGSGLKSVLDFGIKGFQTLGKVGVDALRNIGNFAKKIGSKFASMLNPFKKLTSASNGLNKSLAGGFKNVLKYAFGIRSIFVLFNKLRNAVKEGMKNLAQYSDETNASVSMLKNSLTQLKNSVAAAASPLLDALAPALDAIIQLCVKATNSINQLISALLGKATWIHAKKLTDSYRDSLNGASKAAEKLQKGVRAFDELNLITTPDDNDGGSGAGTAAVDMFETLDVEKPFSDLAERIKEMWEKADFTELGAMVGGKIKAGLESIDWRTIQGNVARVSKSLATFINGLVEVEGLGYTVGTSIGEGFNTALIAVNTFLDNTHWDSIGQFIGEGLNGLFDTVDWEGIGHFFAQRLNATFTTLENIITTFDWIEAGADLATALNTYFSDTDWEGIGRTVVEGINSVFALLTSFISEVDWYGIVADLMSMVTTAIQTFDWAGLGTLVSESLSALLDMILSFILETDWGGTIQSVIGGIGDFIGHINWGELIGKIGAAIDGIIVQIPGIVLGAIAGITDFVANIFSGLGLDSVAGFFKGISDKLTNLRNWLKENLVDPFVDGVKALFGIHSPSTVMAEMGKFLMQGLFNGISSLVEKVMGVFTKIKEKIIGVWNNIKTATTNVWNGIKEAIKTPINAIIGFINGMISGVVDGMNGMIGALNKLSFDVPDWVPGLGGKTFGFNLSMIQAPQIQYLASGGFIENPHSYSMFMMGENGIPEMLGTVGGQPAVAGGQEITGISDTIRSETERQNELLRQQNQLLQELLRKDFGITKDEIGQAARDYSQEYFEKNGKPAFAY